MDICVYTLGCKVNQYESGVIVAKLKKAGYNAFEGLAKADCFILNTCAVTAEAEKKSRQAVAKMVKLNPNCKIYIVGCASQNNADQFDRYANVKYIKGVASKTDIADIIGKDVAFCEKDVEELPLSYQSTPFAEIVKTRQTIKIQEGCNNFCSYCLVPYLRGRSRSRNAEDIMAEATACDGKVNEIVLTGIDISSYGKDTGDSLGGLVTKLSGLKAQIRLGSLEVNVIDRGLMRSLAGCANFCPHFHLSLQSGSDTVLKKMNRHYTTAEYLDKVNLIREYFPDAGITTDVIVGFPEESDQEFSETCRFVREVGFSDIHVFPYSARKGTVAAKFKQVSDDVKKQRVEKLTEIKQALKSEFLLKHVGRDVKILTEEINGDYIAGYTPNYMKIYIDKNKAKENVFCVVKTKELFRDGLIGEVIL